MRLRNLLMVLLLCMTVGIFSACVEGDTGPMGPQGEPGAPGEPGQNPSAEELRMMIEAAIAAALPDSPTREEVTTQIAEAITMALADRPMALTQEEIQSIIDTAIGGLNNLSEEDVNRIADEVARRVLAESEGPPSREDCTQQVLRRSHDGGSGNDTICGNERDNTIDGKAGDDTIFGFAGKDTIIGGDGDDDLYGGEDNDTLEGGEGRDDLYGEAGDDTLRGGMNSDSLDGGEGTDIADYSKVTAIVDGDDDGTLDALTATDTGVTVDLSDDYAANDGYGNEDDLIGIENIIGSNGVDKLTGDDGNNRIEGGTGSDTIMAGAGDDTVVYDSADTTVGGVDGGEGNDTLIVSATATLNAAGGIGGDPAADPTKGFENLMGNVDLTGNAMANILTGGDTANTLTGGGGSDTLNGKGGADILTGGDGNDIYVIGYNEGADTVTLIYTVTEKDMVHLKGFPAAKRSMAKITHGTSEAILVDGDTVLTLGSGSADQATVISNKSAIFRFID